MNASTFPVRTAFVRVFVVAFALIGIGDGEVSDGLIELVALAEIAADHGRLPQRAWDRARIQPHTWAY